MTELAAKDAELEIDGIGIKSSSNVVKDVVTGVDLSLKATTEDGKPIRLTISNDTADLETRLKTFVDAYNKARDTMKNLSAYDATEKSAAVLNGDSSITSVMNQLRGLLSGIPEDSNGVPLLDKDNPSSFLTNLGIETSSTGVLSLNTTKLKSAMENDLASVTRTIAAYGSEFNKVTTQINGSDGLIAGRLDGLNSTSSRLKDGIGAQERRLEIVQTRYEKQFVGLETLLSSMTKTSNYLSQQLASLSRLSAG
jgi:flagellar hook-associated protein 2